MLEISGDPCPVPNPQPGPGPKKHLEAAGHHGIQTLIRGQAKLSARR